ncbi:hypothetical protein Hanom_Chr14g01267051 [Helianthus anomalus]
MSAQPDLASFDTYEKSLVLTCCPTHPLVMSSISISNTMKGKKIHMTCLCRDHHVNEGKTYDG